MVRRLVEEEQRRPLEEQARQRRPHPPAARELGERAREIGLPEAEPAQDDPRLGLEPVAAQRLEAVLEVPVARGQRARPELRGAAPPAPPAGARRSQTSGNPDSASPRTEPRASPAASCGEVADGRLAGPAHAARRRAPPARRGSGRAWSCRSPFGPTSPMRSRPLSCHVTSRKSTRSPYALETPRAGSPPHSTRGRQPSRRAQPASAAVAVRRCRASGRAARPAPPSEARGLDQAPARVAPVAGGPLPIARGAGRGAEVQPDAGRVVACPDRLERRHRLLERAHGVGRRVGGELGAPQRAQGVPHTVRDPDVRAISSALRAAA